MEVICKSKCPSEYSFNEYQSKNGSVKASSTTSSRAVEQLKKIIISPTVFNLFILVQNCPMCLPTTFMYKQWPDQEGLVNEERMSSPTCSYCPPLQMQISKRILERIAQCRPLLIHFVMRWQMFTLYLCRPTHCHKLNIAETQLRRWGDTI